MGAENLLGHGDMLYSEAGNSMPVRVHGAFVEDHEVHKVVAFLKAQHEPDYIEEITQETVLAGEKPASGGDDVDVLYDEAVAIVTETRKASISYVQRRLKIGYNRAARMIEEMESAGVVSTMQSNGSREVLVAAPPPEYSE
jgi:S-DNA-T family DNA segregation ATPase FtsK/SpoIIIE